MFEINYFDTKLGKLKEQQRFIIVPYKEEEKNSVIWSKIDILLQNYGSGEK